MASSLKLVKFQQMARAKGVPDAQINSFIQQAMTQPQTQQQPMTQPGVAGASTQIQFQKPTNQNASTQTTVNTQNTGNFITRFMGALVEPAVNYGKMVAGAGYEAYRAGKAKKTGDNSIFLKQNPFLKEEELDSFSSVKGAAIEGAKRTAGAMSYVIPGGKSIKGAAALAGIAGGLDAVSREGATPDSVLTSAVTSGVAGGVIGAGAKALNAIKPQKVGQAMQQAGKQIKVQTYVKEMGIKPIAREGGNKLLENMKRIGITPGNAENVLEQTKKVIQDNSGTIFQATQQLDQKGVKIAIKEVVSELQNQLKNAKSTITRKPIQEVIDVIKKDFGKAGTLTPSDLYLLKAEYGPLGSWNSLSSTVEKTKAEVWRDVYIKMNSVLDTTLQKNGFEEFRSINDAVHTAIQASQWAQRVGNIAPNRLTFGLSDLIAGAGGLAGGGLPGAVAIGTAKKVVESGKFQAGVGNVVENTGEVLSNMKGTNLPLGSPELNTAIKTGVNQSTPGPVIPDQLDGIDNDPKNENSNNIQGVSSIDNENSISQEFQNIPSVTPSPMNPFGNLNKRQVMALALANGANVKEVKEMGELYDMMASDTGTVSAETQKVANDMRTEYNKLTQQNKYLEVSQAYGRVQSAPDTLPGDVSLVYGFMKLLDPGSVVREGEFATAENSPGIPEQVRNQYNKALNNRRLTPEQRAGYVQAARAAFQPVQQKQQQIDELYYGLSQRYGLDPSLIGIGSLR